MRGCWNYGGEYLSLNRSAGHNSGLLSLHPACSSSTGRQKDTSTLHHSGRLARGEFRPDYPARKTMVQALLDATRRRGMHKECAEVNSPINHRNQALFLFLLSSVRFPSCAGFEAGEMNPDGATCRRHGKETSAVLCPSPVRKPRCALPQYALP